MSQQPFMEAPGSPREACRGQQHEWRGRQHRQEDADHPQQQKTAPSTTHMARSACCRRLNVASESGGVVELGPGNG
jgi:hypothetical protein